MKALFSPLVIISGFIFLTACSGGPGALGPLPEADDSTFAQTTEASLATTLVSSRAGFQSSGIKVAQGDKIKISSRGTWSAGLTTPQGQRISCGAEGCNSRDANGVEQGGLDTYRFDGRVVFQHYDVALGGYRIDHINPGETKTITVNDGVNNGAYTYSVPRDNGGTVGFDASGNPIAGVNDYFCSGKSRLLQLRIGVSATATTPGILVPWQSINAHECARAKYSALLMKIVPAGTMNHSTVAPLVAAKNYETTPLTIEQDGVLYFAHNDGIGGQSDNEGSLEVQVEFVD